MKNRTYLASLAMVLALASNVQAAGEVKGYAGAQVNYNQNKIKDCDEDCNFNFPSFGVVVGAKYGVTNEVFVDGNVGLNFGSKKKTYSDGEYKDDDNYEVNEKKLHFLLYTMLIYPLVIMLQKNLLYLQLVV